MSVLILDFEATSVDPKTARILEIGAMVTDNEFNPIEGKTFSELVWEPGYPDLTPEVSKITNITQEMLGDLACVPQAAFLLLGDLVDKDLECVIAYNVAYDGVLFNEELFRNHFTLNPKMNWLIQLPWLCAMADVETNYAFKSWRLMHVALEYGVAVDPKLLHRALADVELTRQVLKASGVTPKQMLAFQTEPWIYVQAIVEKPWEDGGKSTTLAKAVGYSWERAKGDYSERTFPKRWVKRIKQKDYDKELTLPFKVEKVMI